MGEIRKIVTGPGPVAVRRGMVAGASRQVPQPISCPALEIVPSPWFCGAMLLSNRIPWHVHIHLSIYTQLYTFIGPFVPWPPSSVPEYPSSYGSPQSYTCP